MRALKLAWRNFCRQKVRTSLAVLGVVIGISSLVFFLAVADGAQNITNYREEQTLGMDEIKVMAKDQNSIFMNLQGKNNRLSDKSVEEIKTLPHVKSVNPLLLVKLPTSLIIGFVGRDFETDTPLYSVEESAFSDIKDFKDNDEYVPVIISTGLMEIYNAGIAPSMGLPNMNKEMLTGLNLKVYFGYSSLFNVRGREQAVYRPGKIVGFSSRIPLTGITIPRTTLEKIKTQLNPSPDINFVSLTVLADKPENVAELSQLIRDRGYATTSLNDLLESANRNISILRMVLSLISIIILFVSLLNIFNLVFGLVKERIREIGILRALGRTRVFIMRLFLYESALIGVFGGVIGVILGGGFAFWANNYFADKLPFIIQEKITIVQMSWSIAGGALLFSIILSMISGVYPAIMASRLRPLEAIRK